MTEVHQHQPKGKASTTVDAATVLSVRHTTQRSAIDASSQALSAPTAANATDLLRVAKAMAKLECQAATLMTPAAFASTSGFTIRPNPKTDCSIGAIGSA